MQTFVLAAFMIAYALNLCFCIKKSKYGCFYTKLLLTPLILILYLVRTDAPDILILLALLSGLFGDLFLELSDKKPFFLLGLFSFLAGHIFYGIYFIKDTGWLQSVPWWFYTGAVVYAGFGFVFYMKLSIRDKQEKKAAAIYCGVVLLMSFLALLRVWNYSGFAFWSTFAGSLLFIASDSLLALNRFKKRTRYGGVLVMATYGMAQLLIIMGL